jgi:hypothetical protein
MCLYSRLYLLTKGDDRPQYRAIGGVLGLLIFIIPVLYAALFSLKLKEHGRLYLGDGVSAWDAIGAGLAHTMLGISWAAYVAIGAIALYVILLGYAILAKPMDLEGNSFDRCLYTRSGRGFCFAYSA